MKLLLLKPPPTAPDPDAPLPIGGPWIAGGTGGGKGGWICEYLPPFNPPPPPPPAPS